METVVQREELIKSRPVWGAWIEIKTRVAVCRVTLRRAPYGARGLKFSELVLNILRYDGRAPYGARGLKLVEVLIQLPSVRRAPYGARGLKFWGSMTKPGNGYVAPRMGRVD